MTFPHHCALSTPWGTCCPAGQSRGCLLSSLSINDPYRLQGLVFLFILETLNLGYIPQPHSFIFKLSIKEGIQIYKKGKNKSSIKITCIPICPLLTL